jgi:hypothetical protein
LVQIKPLGLGGGYMFRKLGMLCVATLVVGIAHMLRLQQELFSMRYGDDVYGSETFFALVLAWWHPFKNGLNLTSFARTSSRG